MAGTFCQIYIQFVFAVKGRTNLLDKSWRKEVFRYISGIISGNNQKSIIVNGVSDHVHALVGMKSTISISELIQDIKASSSKFINDQKYLPRKFEWQSGYGAFSYAHSQLDSVYKYIENQEEHHQKQSFRTEYIELLRNFEMNFDERYLFDWI